MICYVTPRYSGVYSTNHIVSELIIQKVGGNMGGKQIEQDSTVAFL